MPDLTSMFKLPTLAEATAVKDQALNYAMAAPKKLLEEGMAKVQGVFGAIQNPFSKLSQSVPVPTKITGVTEVQGSATEMKGAVQNPDSADESTSHKVKLVAQVSDGNSDVIASNPNFAHEPLMQRVVEFDVMPEVQEIHSAEYEALSAPHMPLEFQKYKGTKSIQWQINGTFTCRTRDEARRNYVYLNNLRGWTKPYFGENQRTQFIGKLGAPPPVLDFSGWRGLVGTVPTVITSLNWNWPKDCDWIPTGIFDADGGEIPFPTVMNVNIALVESFSPDQVNGFNLVEFRNGNMVGAWSASVPQDPGPDVSEAMGSNGGNQSITNGTPQPGGDEDGDTVATTDDYPAESRGFATGDTTPGPLLPGESLSVAHLTVDRRVGMGSDEDAAAARIAAGGGVDEAKSTPALVAQGVPADQPPIQGGPPPGPSKQELLSGYYKDREENNAAMLENQNVRNRARIELRELKASGGSPSRIAELEQTMLATAERDDAFQRRYNTIESKITNLGG